MIGWLTCILTFYFDDLKNLSKLILLLGNKLIHKKVIIIKIVKLMGAYLDAPIKDKNPEPGQNEMAVWGACAM